MFRIDQCLEARDVMQAFLKVEGKSGCLFKYIRTSDDVFRFCLDELYSAKHSEMVSEDEEAISAGRIKIDMDGNIKVYDYSMTLKLGPMPNDQELIVGLLMKERRNGSSS